MELLPLHVCCVDDDDDDDEDNGLMLVLVQKTYCFVSVVVV